jgi:hypothetical protein
MELGCCFAAPNHCFYSNAPFEYNATFAISVGAGAGAGKVQCFNTVSHMGADLGPACTGTRGVLLVEANDQPVFYIARS